MGSMSEVEGGGRMGHVLEGVIVWQALELFTVAYLFANVQVYNSFLIPLDRYASDRTEENMKNMRRELLLAVGFFAFTGSGLRKQSHRSNDREQARDLLKVLDLPIWNLVRDFHFPPL